MLLEIGKMQARSARMHQVSSVHEGRNEEKDEKGLVIAYASELEISLTQNDRN